MFALSLKIFYVYFYIIFINKEAYFTVIYNIISDTQYFNTKHTTSVPSFTTIPGTLTIFFFIVCIASLAHISDRMLVKLNGLILLILEMI